MWLNDMERAHLYHYGWKYQGASSIDASFMFTSHINTPHTISAHTLEHLLRFSLLWHKLPFPPIFPYRGNMILRRANEDRVVGSIDSSGCCACHVFPVVFLRLEFLFPFFRLRQFCLLRFFVRYFPHPKYHFYRQGSHCRPYQKYCRPHPLRFGCGRKLYRIRPPPPASSFVKADT